MLLYAHYIFDIIVRWNSMFLLQFLYSNFVLEFKLVFQILIETKVKA